MLVLISEISLRKVGLSSKNFGEERKKWFKEKNEKMPYLKNYVLNLWSRRWLALSHSFVKGLSPWGLLRIRNISSINCLKVTFATKTVFCNKVVLDV